MSPTVGSYGALTLNAVSAAFYVPLEFSADMYDVVRDNGARTHMPSNLQAIFGAGNDPGHICTNTTVQNDIKSCGFLSLGSNCGTALTENS